MALGMFNPRTVRRAIERGRRTYDGRDWPATFSNRLTAPVPGWRQALAAGRQGAFRTDTSHADRIPVRRDGLPSVAPAQTAVTWVGHASYVLRIGGLTVLTDPVWSNRIPGVRPRLTPPGVDWADVRADAVVISHNHYDHLDAPTIRRLPRGIMLLVPGALGWWFRRRGFTNVHELDWWKSVRLDGVRFDFVPSHHWSRRTLTDTCASLWGGWVLTGPDGQRIYFAGDTGYGHYFTEIAARYPGIDVALMPVGAYLPRWFMRPVHMSPEEAVLATATLGATYMATMHWGTFVLSAEPLLAPVEEARLAWDAAGRPRENLWDLAVGESRVIG